MKSSGAIIFIVGVVLTIYTSFSFITREKVVDLGEVEIMANKKHGMNWSPLIGVGMIAAGAGLYLAGMKKKS
jgi:prepilin signal peptidase PulO-like enzyme (type II secretory pathway)